VKRKLQRNQPMVILVGGIVLLAAALGVVFLLSRGGDGKAANAGQAPANGADRPSKSTSGTSGGEEKFNKTPADQWTVLLGELPQNYQVDVSNTFAMTVSTFSSSYWFTSEQEGQDRSKEWKIADGYQVYFQPKGLAAEVLQGSFFLQVETYMFADTDGAKKAYAYFDNLMKTRGSSEPVTAKQLGNESAAYRIVGGTVGTSEMVGVYHRFNFRRGNTIVSVQTWGGQQYMNIDPAREVAVSIDNKLLGTRPAVEPTPIPTPSFPGLSN
jgi:hypothetical protein